jgi:DNA-binding Lrp family transcriptional regulator
VVDVEGASLMLRNAELRALIALHDNPLGDINSLSKLAKMSPATLVRNLKRLQTEGILDKGGFVSAQISYSAVGLELVAVFMNVPQENLKNVEALCDLYPYSTYRVRCFGSTNGIFALFAVPVGSISLLLQLLDTLKKKDVFTDYHWHRLLNQQIYTEADFRLYDNRTGTWSFNWADWERILNENDSPALEECPPSVLHQMTAVDMQILKRLSIDARKERKEIAKDVGIPPYHLSRRLKFYRLNRINGAYRIVFGLTSLNLVTPALAECVVDAQTKERIGYAASKLPFQGNFIPTETGFILYSTLPAPDFPRLATALLKHVEKAGLMWCDYASSVRYWFDSGEESNFRDGKWLVTKEFLVDDVLRSLELE